MWLLLAIIGYFILALVVILDKLIVSKSRKADCIHFYSTIFMFGRCWLCRLLVGEC